MNVFEFDSQPLALLPEGAAFDPASSALIVADVHLGKSAAFRAQGLPVPEGDTERDLSRLVKLTEATGAKRLVIAGDLFHAPAGVTPEIESALRSFFATLSVPVDLIRGNHDAKLRQLPAGMKASPALDLGGLRILHDPKDADDARLHLAGHWHPVVKIPDGKRTSLRLPCFLYRNRTLILPSFGSFTGGAIIPPESGDRTFVALRHSVIELPRELLG